MDTSLLRALTGAVDLRKTTNTVGTGLNEVSGTGADGSVFQSVLNTAISNLQTTNSYLSDAEDQGILFALGESDSTHDLMVSLQKASTALQYTVAIRDKLLEAYKEIMQIQI